MVKFIPEYVKYSRILGIYTLAIRIRQYSWWMQEVLKNINPNITKLRKKIHKIKKETFISDISEIRNISNMLASELRRWMHYLKLIYFHNSAILHLQLKILLRIYGEIKKKKKTITDMKRKEKEREKLKILNHRLKNIRKEIKYISKTDEVIIRSLKSFKKGFNKSLRKGHSIRTVTFLKERRLSQKIKIKAREIKKIEENRKKLMQKLNIDNISQLRKLADYLKKQINNSEKDVLYTRQLIKKLKKKNKHIEKIIKHLGKKMFRMKASREVINRTLLSINKPFKDLEASIHSDLEKMFYNALRQLNLSVRRFKKIA